MDMNRAFFLKNEDRDPKWHLIDAKDLVVGRLATKIADILRGKNRAFYTPYIDCGDYVVVINAKDLVFTGDKWNQKIYQRYTGYLGNLKEITAKEMLLKNPEAILELAVKRMLPKNKLSRSIIKKLKIYVGNDHPHKAQIRK
jgi:large subunit ribosomal protein L13